MGRVKAFFNVFLLIIFTSFIFHTQAQASIYPSYNIASSQQNRVSDETLRKIEKINNTDNVYDLKTEDKVPIEEFFKLVRCFQDEEEVMATYTFEEIQSIAFFFIKFARIGVSSEDEEKLEREIEELLSAFEDAEEALYLFEKEKGEKYSFSSSVYDNSYVIASSDYTNEMNIIRSGVLSKIGGGIKKGLDKTRHAIGKAAKETGKFVASACGKVVDFAVEHPVITGIVLTTVTVGTVTYFIYSSNKEEDDYLPSQSSSDTIEGMNPESIPNAQLSVNEMPQFSESIEAQLGSLKEIIQTNDFLRGFNNVEQSKPLAISPYTVEVLDSLYKRTGPDGFLFDVNQNTSLFFSKQELKETVFYLEGHQALNDQYHDMAIDSFGKAIETNPQNYNIYLDRAYAYLEKGEFDNSLNDYTKYKESELKNYLSKGIDILQESVKICWKVRVALDKGVIDSGKQLLASASNAIEHPIDTTIAIYEIVDLIDNFNKNCIFHPIDTYKEAYNKITDSNTWISLRDAIVPELRELFEDWENLNLDEKVEGVAYLLSKVGGDIITPGAATKVMAQGIKEFKTLVTIAKSFKKTEKVILLEALAETGGSSGTFAEVVNSNRVFESASSTGKFIEGLSIKKLAEAGKVADKAGLTKAGRALAKHGGREGSVFPKPTGTPMQINQQGQEILEKILTHPDKKIIKGSFERYGEVIDIEVSNLGGLRYSKDGQLIGFLEPKK